MLATSSPATGHRSARVRALAGLTAVALAVDGIVHLAVAGRYAVPGGGVLAESNLFRGQAVVALAVAAWAVLRPSVASFAVAALVAVTAAAAVITSTYVDLGPIGPLPDLYEPTWAAPGKVMSMVAEVLAVPLAVVGAGCAISERR